MIKAMIYKLYKMYTINSLILVYKSYYESYNSQKYTSQVNK